MFRCALAAAVVLAFSCTGGDDGNPTTPGGGGSGVDTAFVTGSLDRGAYASGIRILSNRVAYVSELDDGLAVIDISDKTAPAFVTALGGIRPEGNITGTTRIHYLSAGTEGVHVVDADTAASPLLVTTSDTPGQVGAVALSGGTLPVLCVADGTAGVRFFFGESGSSAVDTPGLARGVAVKLPYCFVTDLPDGGGGPALYTIDISDPASPAMVDTLQLSGSPSDIALKGNYLYIPARDPGMFVINITDPLNATVIGQTGPFPATGVVTADTRINRVYVGTEEALGFSGEGLRVVDVSSVKSPKTVQTLDLPDATTGVTYNSGRVYVTTSDLVGSSPATFHIIDVSGL
jgi:hypothetical protein